MTHTFRHPEDNFLTFVTVRQHDLIKKNWNYGLIYRNESQFMVPMITYLMFGELGPSDIRSSSNVGFSEGLLGGPCFLRPS